MLSVNEYDEAERNISSRMPNRIIQAFKPITFQEIGYPSRINHEYELFRYIDVMHEFGFDREFLNLLGNLTEDEFDILRRITKKICSFSESEFQLKSVARACVINGLNILRHITETIESGRQKDEKVIGIDQVNKFYTGILDSSQHLTSDETFMNYIEYSC